MTIEMTTTVSGESPAANPKFTSDASRNIFATVTLADSAGKDARFPNTSAEACSNQITSSFACADVAVYKFSPAGDMVYVSYLAGRTAEEAKFIALAANGDLVVTGNTDSTGAANEVCGTSGGALIFLAWSSGGLLCSETRSRDGDAAGLDVFRWTKRGSDWADGAGLR
jgi:hypothetical protein